MEDKEEEAEPFLLPQQQPPPQDRPKTSDTKAAFIAADAASAATASVISCGVKPEDLAARLVGNDGLNTAESSPPAMCDRLATCHRLNEHFAACRSFEAAQQLQLSQSMKRASSTKARRTEGPTKLNQAILGMA